MRGYILCTIVTLNLRAVCTEFVFIPNLSRQFLNEHIALFFDDRFGNVKMNSGKIPLLHVVPVYPGKQSHL